MLVWRVLRQAVEEFIEHGALSRGAAIAFYTVTSLAPLLLLVIAIAGMAIGRDVARAGVIDELSGLVGPDGADMILVTASGIFGEMQTALNATWQVKPSDEPWPSLIRARAASLGLVAALGFVTIVSLAVSAALSAFGQELAMRTPAGNVLLILLNTGLSLVVFALLFAAIYTVLP